MGADPGQNVAHGARRSRQIVCMKTQLQEIQYPALQAALERFEGGMGEPFDPSESWHYSTFLTILEDEVRRELTRRIVDAFREATDRLLEEKRSLEETRAR